MGRKTITKDSSHKKDAAPGHPEYICSPLNGRGSPRPPLLPGPRSLQVNAERSASDGELSRKEIRPTIGQIGSNHFGQFRGDPLATKRIFPAHRRSLVAPYGGTYPRWLVPMDEKLVAPPPLSPSPYICPWVGPWVARGLFLNSPSPFVSRETGSFFPKRVWVLC